MAVTLEMAPLDVLLCSIHPPPPLKTENDKMDVQK